MDVKLFYAYGLYNKFCVTSFTFRHSADNIYTSVPRE